MNRGIRRLSLCVLTAGLVFSPLSGFAQEGATTQPASSAETQANMPQHPLVDSSPEAMAEGAQRWMEVMVPGKGHALLQPFVGEWTTTTKIWMAGPGSEPMTSHGESTSEWILDGRFLLSQDKSEMIFPGEDGTMQKAPYSGRGWLGYDNNRKLFVGSWIDSASTQLLTFKGGVDVTGKVFTFYGEMDEPMLGVYGRSNKYVFRSVDEDTHTFEIYDLLAGPDYKVVEITYKRKKD